MPFYVAETTGSILVREVSLFRRSLIERFYCKCTCKSFPALRHKGHRTATPRVHSEINITSNPDTYC